MWPSVKPSYSNAGLTFRLIKLSSESYKADESGGNLELERNECQMRYVDARDRGGAKMFRQ